MCKIGAWFAQMYHRVRNHFGCKLISVHLEIVLILTQDRCTVCAKCTIGSVIILDAPNGTPRW
jgi:hypothetical protein